MKNEYSIICRVDRETKNKIDAINFNESHFIRMSIKQMLIERNSQLNDILYLYNINNQKIKILEDMSAIIKKNIEKYDSNIQRINRIEKPINLQSFTPKQLDESKKNIRNISNRDVEINKDMLIHNSNLTGINVKRFVELLKEDNILPEHRDIK